MTEPPTVPLPARSKRLAVFLDGTWNAVDSNTNVWRMKELCATAASEDVPQLTHYEIGVNGVLGGIFGDGLTRNIRRAYEWLIDNYNEGDDIFIFGFSRGAYTARSLAGFIARLGLLEPGAPLGVAQLYARYQRSSARTIRALRDEEARGTLRDVTIEERWMLKYAQAVPIKMVGVWDTVGELGIPLFSIEGISRSTLGFLDTGLRLPIENGYHALAIDEHRRVFAPTLWTVRRSSDPNAAQAAPRSTASVEQRWFVGAHANVGGGCTDDLLAQVPLRWMMQKASTHGLAFRRNVEIDDEILAAQIQDSYARFMKGAYSRLSRPYYRPIGALPVACAGGAEINVNETIDGSVFERWRAGPAYRPANLLAWAQLRTADPAAIIGPVRADDPRVAVPQ